MTFVVVSAPTEEPVTVDEFKKHARISGNATNAEIEAMIIAARQYAELELGRWIITQTIDAYFDDWQPCIKLPPLQSVTSISYVDNNGATQTLASNLYRVDSKSKPARITEASGVSWPSLDSVTNAVTVRFVAGYGAKESVPECIKHWIKLRVEHYFDNRGPNVVSGSVVEFGRHYIDGLLDPERLRARV
jgi:uncharacterized phiE125 gp8 family phage protein